MIKFFKLNNIKSLNELDAKNLKELWSKIEKDYDGIAMDFGTEFKKLEDNSFNAIFSTDTEDRDGDIIYQDFELKNFKKNPVFLDSHRYDSIERIIGKVKNIKISEGKLQGTVMFAIDNPKGLLAAKLADKGFLNATSIGFIPKQFDDKGNILKAEILEISAVGVPSNPQALFEKAKKEIDEKGKEDSLLKYEIDGKSITLKNDDGLIEIIDIKEIDSSTNTTEEKPKEKEEKKEKKLKPKKNKNQMIKSAVDEIIKDRKKILKKVVKITDKYVEKLKSDGLTKQEKKVINKTVRKLLEAKKLN